MMRELQDLSARIPKWPIPTHLRYASEATSPRSSKREAPVSDAFAQQQHLFAGRFARFIERIERRRVHGIRLRAEVRRHGHIAHHEHGRLLRAVTRGDGTQGRRDGQRPHGADSAPQAQGDDWPDYFEYAARY